MKESIGAIIQTNNDDFYQEFGVTFEEVMANATRLAIRRESLDKTAEENLTNLGYKVFLAHKKMAHDLGYTWQQVEPLLKSFIFDE